MIGRLLNGGNVVLHYLRGLKFIFIEFLNQDMKCMKEKVLNITKIISSLMNPYLKNFQSVKKCMLKYA